MQPFSHPKRPAEHWCTPEPGLCKNCSVHSGPKLNPGLHPRLQHCGVPDIPSGKQFSNIHTEPKKKKICLLTPQILLLGIYLQSRQSYTQSIIHNNIKLREKRLNAH